MKYKISVYLKGRKRPLELIVASMAYVDQFYALLENGPEHTCVKMGQLIFSKASFDYADYEPFEEKKKIFQKK